MDSLQRFFRRPLAFVLSITILGALISLPAAGLAYPWTLGIVDATFIWTPPPAIA